MIYSASRRTELVAFYPGFIVDKVKRARSLDAIVFWTKDPRNLCDHFGLSGVVLSVPSVVQLTITGLAGGPWEPNVPKPEEFEEQLASLATDLPKGAINWRFDPIIVDADMKERFDRILDFVRRTVGELRAFTVSFAQPYAYAKTRIKEAGLELPDPSPEAKRDTLAWMREKSGLVIQICAQDNLQGISGVEPAHCVDAALIDRLYGTNLGDLPKDQGQRPACGCCQSTDIGSYHQKCHHGCLYCYARQA